MDPLHVDIKHGKDMWFARDSTGKTDSSREGDGGVAKVSSFLNSSGIYTGISAMLLIIRMQIQHLR